MSTDAQPSHLKRQFTHAPLPFALVFDDKVPDTGSAVKDGVFYIDGDRAGQVRSVTWSPGGYIGVLYDDTPGKKARR